jgi:uncharacterized protein
VKEIITSVLLGFIFALGLGLGGMTQPQKVIGFLDVMNWDPALLFVMMGAVGVHALIFPFLRRRKKAVWGSPMQIPDRRDITFNLIVGSAIFGIGWGIAGYCPAPAITAVASGSTDAALFVAAMLVGMRVASR